MEIIHVSAECYPVAKAGGLGDVVGEGGDDLAIGGGVDEGVVAVDDFGEGVLIAIGCDGVEEGGIWGLGGLHVITWPLDAEGGTTLHDFLK